MGKDVARLVWESESKVGLHWVCVVVVLLVAVVQLVGLGLPLCPMFHVRVVRAPTHGCEYQNQGIQGSPSRSEAIQGIYMHHMHIRHATTRTCTMYVTCTMAGLQAPVIQLHLQSSQS